MNVLPSEEELMVKNAAREFLDAECPSSLPRAIEQDERGYSVELWEQMASLGWFGISLPEAYGGGGLPVTYLGLILEECGRAIAPVPFHSTATAALAIANHGSDAQKQAILPRVARGDLIMTWAAQEQDPASAPTPSSARAKWTATAWSSMASSTLSTTSPPPNWW